MKNSSLWLVIAGTVVCLGACQSAPDTINDSPVVETTQGVAVESEQVSEDSVEAEPKVSKPVMWAYKNNDTWSQVITNEARDIRGEESDSSRCQGAADIQIVGECLNWSLSVPCETDGETWFYGESAPTDGSICRAKSGEWTLKSPRYFQEHGKCQLQVDEVADQEVATFRIDCNWLSEDRMKKGNSSFSFEPMNQ